MRFGYAIQTHGRNEALVEPAPQVRQSVLYMPSSNGFINKAVRAPLFVDLRDSNPEPHAAGIQHHPYQPP